MAAEVLGPFAQSEGLLGLVEEVDLDEVVVRGCVGCVVVPN